MRQRQADLGPSTVDNYASLWQRYLGTKELKAFVQRLRSAWGGKAMPAAPENVDPVTLQPVQPPFEAPAPATPSASPTPAQPPSIAKMPDDFPSPPEAKRFVPDDEYAQFVHETALKVGRDDPNAVNAYIADSLELRFPGIKRLVDFKSLPGDEMDAKDIEYIIGALRTWLVPSQQPLPPPTKTMRKWMKKTLHAFASDVWMVMSQADKHMDYAAFAGFFGGHIPEQRLEPPPEPQLPQRPPPQLLFYMLNDKKAEALKLARDSAADLTEEQLDYNQQVRGPPDPPRLVPLEQRGPLPVGPSVSAPTPRRTLNIQAVPDELKQSKRPFPKLPVTKK